VFDVLQFCEYLLVLCKNVFVILKMVISFKVSFGPLVKMAVEHMPPPEEAQRYRLRALFKDVDQAQIAAKQGAVAKGKAGAGEIGGAGAGAEGANKVEVESKAAQEVVGKAEVVSKVRGGGGESSEVSARLSLQRAAAWAMHQAVAACDPSPQAPLVAFVSKASSPLS